MITHAGHGTVLKTLAAGVPLVCVPMAETKPITPYACYGSAPAYG